MGKAAVDLDMMVNQIRYSYLTAASAGNWETAAHFVYILNQTISAKNRITDLKPFEPFKDIRRTLLREELYADFKAKGYCIHNMPLVEAAITRERDMLMAQYR